MTAMNGEKQELLLLDNIVRELQHIKDKLTNTNTKLDTIILNQNQELMKLDQIITNTTPAKSTDVAGFDVTVDKPTKQ